MGMSEGTLRSIFECDKSYKGRLEELVGNCIGKKVILELSEESTYHQANSNFIDGLSCIFYSECRFVAKFSLRPLPSCYAFCISYNTEVAEFFRKKGIGTVLQKIKQDIALQRGFSNLMCTTTPGNKAQNKLLKKDGWKKVFDTAKTALYSWIAPCVWIKPLRNEDRGAV
jgi:hypothetical protein